ncbi:GGDEF domain-containing protein [Salinarimonas chemoclinalis]|uniref:GGDEF domain-containing protein n=1 Tax=Salinarimonas chemoclinalis TaxID=3241599 RepID=UPI003555F854
MIPTVHTSDIRDHATAPEAGAILDAFAELAGEDGRAPVDALFARLDEAVASGIELLEPWGEDDWFYLRYGPAVTATYGLDMAGRLVSEMPEPSAQAYRELLHRVRRERKPMLAVLQSLAVQRVRSWEKLILPCKAPCGADRIATFVTARLSREDLLTAVLEASQDGIMSVRAVRDPQGRVVDAVIVTANQQASEYSGHPVWRLVYGSFKALFPGLVARRVWERCVRVIDERATERFEINISHRRLDTWLRVTIVPLDDGFVISFCDVTDLKYALIEAECSREELAAEIEQRLALEQELRRLSHTDELTQTLNRRGFDAALRREIALAGRYQRPFSLVAVDIDHFKRINDVHGHAAGDRVLAAVSELLRSAVRADADVIGRIGGEEFVLLLPSTRKEGAMALAERIRERLAAQSFDVAGERIAVSASFGVAEGAPDTDEDAVLRAADAALYAAKRSGRNRVCLARPAADVVRPQLAS